MAETIQVDGVALVKCCTIGGTLATVGRSINGVEITEQTFTDDVFSDENGGEKGPAIDVQMLGQMHIIRITMAKYDESEVDKIRASIAGGTAGTPGTAGTLYFQGAVSWRLLIHSTNRPRNYTNVVFQEPKEINKGTIHSKCTIIAKAYKDSNGVLYNATTT